MVASYTVQQSELVRTFAVLENRPIMCFLGAGASARAGIPTASEMTWMFKREIYCSETAVAPEAIRDLSTERNRRRLQEFFQEVSGYPAVGAETEYSFYFEQCYPSPLERRAFVRRMLSQGKPTIGHECLAALLAKGYCDWVWTTNFDDLLERAERGDAARRLSQVGPESHNRLDRILSEHLYPVLVKLHGDFRFDSLQNTDEELQTLDEELRSKFVRVSNDKGLIVIGYSGRDESVMSTLEDAAASGGLSSGLYWCLLDTNSVNPRVERLVTQVVDRTHRGGIVEIDGFDDLMFRLYKQCNLRDEQIDAKADALYRERQPFDLTVSSTQKSPVKTNGIKVIEYPTTPYTFSASIAGWDDLKELISGQPVIAGLHRGQVLAYGNRERITKAFDTVITSPIEVTDVNSRDLTHSDSAALGLLYDIIDANLIEKFGLLQFGRRAFFIPDPAASGKSREFRFKYQGKEKRVAAATNHQQVVINEALKYQLDFHEGVLWFVIEPTVFVTRDGINAAPEAQRKVITNEEVSKRYNALTDERLLFWINYLSAKSKPITFSFPLQTEGVRIVLDSYFAFSTMK